MDEMNVSNSPFSAQCIAIVGMAGRFPGANTVAAFWDNLVQGNEALTQFSDEHLRAQQIDPALLAHPAYIKQAPVLADYDRFDADFFGFSPRQAEITDPQLRLFLETAHAALEDAGYHPKGVEGLVGVYAGSAMSGYLLNNLLNRPDVIAKVGQMAAIMANDKDYVATMTSYKLNLKGPSVSVNTACSTSSVAIHLARMALLNYECDTALAGGVRISVPQEVGYLHQEGGISSSDGHCRAFDARADGTIGGSGAGVVVLKRLDDALVAGDNIYAVIRGSAINNDGSDKVGFSAPSVHGQIEVIQEAHAVAGVDPAEVSYVEAHGTGTALGDPIEITALTQAFGSLEKGYCAVGSLKTNVGHLDTAAGVASVIKVAQALHRRRLPPSLNYTVPNPKIDFANSPFFVNDRLREWGARNGRRVAGINSFGIGGTNAHLVLEEAPARQELDRGRQHQLLILSAKTKTALDQAAARLAVYMRRHADLNLADVAYTLQVGREAYSHRLALPCSTLEQAAQLLEDGRAARGEAHPGTPKLCFMFPGQGAQHPEMVRNLYQEESLFRESFDRCAELLRPHLGTDLRDVMVRATLDADSAAVWLRETRHTQPALFAVEYSLARLLMSWGLVPAAMIGHSIGEYVAACLSGVFSLEDALLLVAARGRYMQAAAAGAMLAVSLSESDVRVRMPSSCDIAAVNGQSHCVIAGPDEAINGFASMLEAQGVGYRLLHTSHAFHSRSMEPVLASFAEVVATVACGNATIPFISNINGGWAEITQINSVEYWTRHLREPVRFADGMTTLRADPDMVFIEVGPGATLTKLARQQEPDRTVVPSLPGTTDTLINSIGQLWLAGVPVCWKAMNNGNSRYRVSLPTYPFERQRHWVEAHGGAVPTTSAGKHGSPASWLSTPVWQREPGVLATCKTPVAGEHWLIIGGMHPLTHAIAAQLRAHGCVATVTVTGQQYQMHSDDSFQLRAGVAEDFVDMLSELHVRNQRPQRILHLRALDGTEDGCEELDGLDRLDGPFYSLLHLAKAWDNVFHGAPVKLITVGRGIHAVLGMEALNPENSTALGLAKVLPQEYEGFLCKHVDLDPARIGACDTHQADIALLLGEFEHSFDAVPVAHRGGARWLQAWVPAATVTTPAAPVLRLRGCYLITGGMGGIGLAVAKHLAQHYQAHVVLVGRTPLPERAMWPTLMANTSTDAELCRRLAELMAIEDASAALLTITADVTDTEQMRSVLEQVEHAFGPVHGVFHAAGVAGSGIVANRSDEQAASVIRPKVQGAQALLKAFEGHPEPDFFLLFSSLNALLGGVGQADYAAANAYLDALAYAQQCRHGRRVISVNWDGWRETGMLTRALAQPGGARVDVQAHMMALTTAESLSILESALMTGFPQSAVSAVPLAARIAAAGKFPQPAQVSDAAREAARVAAQDKRRTTDIMYRTPQSELQLQIATIWCDLLGVEDIGIEDDFFLLGGDSLLVMQLNARLRQVVDVKFPLQLLFEKSTIASLTAHLEQSKCQEMEEEQIVADVMSEIIASGVQ